MNFQLAFSVLLSLAAPVVTKGADLKAPPSIDQIPKAFNVLLGKPPSEQQTNRFIFDLTPDGKTTSDVYMTYHELRPTANSDCSVESESSSNWYSTSSSSLKAQASSSSNGFQADFTIGGSMPAGEGGAEVSISTDIRNALVFSNSNASGEFKSNKKSGFHHSFTEASHRGMYDLRVNYGAGTFAWTDPFKKACADLGTAPSVGRVMKFIHEWGTHGIETATMGLKCTATMYMDGDFSAERYADYHKDSSAWEASLLFWTSKGSSTEESAVDTSEKYGFASKAASKKCIGNIKAPAADTCNMPGNGIADSPAIVSWTYKPIWDMDVPGLTDGAKISLKSFFDIALWAAVKCADNNCNGRGVCTPDASIWNSSIDANAATMDFLKLYKSNECFCEDDAEGDHCKEGPRPDFLLDRTGFQDYTNKWDEQSVGKADIGTTIGAISGIASGYRQYHKDRNFKFEYTWPLNEDHTTCATVHPSKGEIQNNDPEGNANSYGQDSWVKCSENRVLHYVRSNHGENEDRQFRYKCASIDGWETDTGDGKCKTSNWSTLGSSNEDSSNNYHEHLCDDGMVMTGMESVHYWNNPVSDRKFKYTCCPLMKKKPTLSAKASSVTNTQPSFQRDEL